MLSGEWKVFKGNLVLYGEGFNCYIMEFVFKFVCSSEIGEVFKDECDIDLCFRDIILVGVCGLI